MRVKIRGRWHSPSPLYPVVLELEPGDRACINAMENSATRIGFFHEDDTSTTEDRRQYVASDDTYPSYIVTQNAFHVGENPLSWKEQERLLQPSLDAAQGKRYQKHPVLIHAFQFTLENEGRQMPVWLVKAINEGTIYYQGGQSPYFTIESGNDKHKVEVGDWFIQGIKGEIYRCPNDVFVDSYTEFHNQ